MKELEEGLEFNVVTIELDYYDEHKPVEYTEDGLYKVIVYVGDKKITKRVYYFKDRVETSLPQLVKDTKLKELNKEPS
jgi:hypothetical protein